MHTMKYKNRKEKKRDIGKMEGRTERRMDRTKEGREGERRWKGGGKRRKDKKFEAQKEKLY